MLHLVCALKCEAQGVIDLLKMAPHKTSTLFDTYLDPSGRISLTVSGIGKTNSSSAVIHAYMLFKDCQNHGWLNFGIAGHANYAKATPVLTVKIIDQATGKTWYPQTLFKPACFTATLVTVDNPSSEYQDTAMYDMEASGFFESAAKVSSLELCHSIKIISDNNIQDIQHINKTTVIKLMEQNLDMISLIADEIIKLINIGDREVYDQSLYLNLTTRHHFTHSQKLQLIKLLKRWQLIQGGETDKIPHQRKFSSSTEILEYLDTSLNEINYSL